MTSTIIDRLDGLSSAAAIKGPCKVATTANITLYGEQTIDGVAVVTGDRVLVKDQTAGYECGIYVVDTGQWRRSKDFNRTNDVVKGTMVFVNSGTVNAETLWAVTSNNPVVVGTSTITFSNNIIVPPDDSVGTDAIQDQAVTTPKIALQAITDELLNSTSNVGINNGRITTPAFHGGSIETMFAATSYSIYVIPAGTYTFAAPFTIPANSVVIAENGAIFEPTFEPTGVDRATPLITLAAGVQINYIKLNLPTGINTIRIGVKVQSNTQIGYFEATSVDLNNNRTESGSTDLISGALLIEGAEHVRIGQVYLSRFDRGWAVIDSTDVVISKIRNLETLMGGYVHGTRDLHILSGYTSGPIDPTEPNSFGRGIMTPGLNSVVLAGCSDSSISNWFTYDILEHGLRVGRVASGTTVPNHRLSFINHKHFRPYGCGHKHDDGDDFNIKRILIQGLYTEDVGHDNWFGGAGYQNWSGGSVNDPLTDNDANKDGCAIRNSQYVTLSNYSNKNNSYANSGYFGLWIERSNYVQGSNIDVEKAKHDGVVVQSGGGTSPERIELRGVATRDNTDSGLLFDATPSNDTWRGIQVIGLDSQNNGGYGYEVTGRLDGASPFATLTSRIQGFVRGNTAGSFLIDSDVWSDADFVDDVEETGTLTPSMTFSTPGDLSLGSVTASGTWKRNGRYVKVESLFTGTPTFTTASGNLRLTGLPFAAAGVVSNMSVQSLSAFVWGSGPGTMLVINTSTGATYCEVRRNVSNSANSPVQAGASGIASGAALTINYAGEYRI